MSKTKTGVNFHLNFFSPTFFYRENKKKESKKKLEPIFNELIAKRNGIEIIMLLVLVLLSSLVSVSDVGVGLGAVLVLVSMVSVLSVTPALVSVFSFAAEPPLFAEIKKEAEFSSNVNNAPELFLKCTFC